MRRPIFNIQKHKASTLHYDFRLEIGGVFKSWAIPKGPSLDPTVKRLALAVEDHDLSHADFEGALGKNSRGSRIVLLWDRSWFEEIVEVGISARSMLENGVFDFVLHGQRLKGRFSLINIKRNKREWVLIKREDDEARVGFDVTAYYQTSILSGKSIQDFEKYGRL